MKITQPLDDCPCGGKKPATQLVCAQCWNSAPQKHREVFTGKATRSARTFGDRMAAKLALLEHANSRSQQPTPRLSNPFGRVLTQKAQT